MTSLLNFFNSFRGGFSFLAERSARDFFIGSLLASVLLFLSAAFISFCAFRINDESVIAAAENIHAVYDSKIVEETKKIAFDSVLCDDFVKSRGVDFGELFASFATSEEVDESQSGSKLPLYAPTVVLKALVVLDGESVCVLDIDGEEPGKVFKAGETFGNGQGRVLNIGESGVRWQWMEREYTAEL